MSDGRSQVRAMLTRSAAFASIAAALFLLVLKVWAAITTDSTAMLGSLADTTLDLVASLATLLGVWIAAQPADDKHRFGHGKAEAITALFQIVLIVISALGIAARAVERLLVGNEVQAAEQGIGVSIAAIAVTLALLAWQRHVIRRTGSLAITTDSVHYQSDLFLNLAVIVALVLDTYVGIAGADALFGFGIAAWLAYGAWGASDEVLDQLMDHEWPEEKKERFLQLLATFPDISGVHDLRTRTSGDKDFVQFHIWVDPQMTVREAHRVMDGIEHRLEADFPGVEVLIHTDPDGLVDEKGEAGRDVLPPIRVGLEQDVKL
ncbi:cation diffusion facilitator family transporter [Novosphingobium mangrovi (ex Hu et al. 2023)]|uniref:Cation diffusion facilitator family transporter n=1 Tax=Novosphingobium mangrovi (ex Hu et al. 2023) TaxID=2930094 RepID=A0ABT0AAW2_9SPHN|nr:cation diffusion facilitator family transporter [Novosphingobium mangrovi (ex Hu et al. 2023)]MCJ1960322.1 cation diffusion facilitator family transporter [Novosphingobium mangrovi (ex Hu et al. 2023)]